MYPNRGERARALQQILDCGCPIDSCHEYGPGEGVNLRDPDGIPLERYYDRPSADWPRRGGQLRLFNKRIETATILAELEHTPPGDI